MSGTSGNDSITTGGGNDSINALGGDDTVTSGSGNDTIVGGTGNDSLTGGSGQDSLTGDQGNDSVNGGSGNDTLFGGDDDDSVDGGSNDDFADGGSGNDLVEGDGGSDTLYGGAGNDTIFGDDEGTGDSGDDLIFGDAGDDLIEGNEGRDTIYGGLDQDTIDGGIGDDSIFGEAGDDRITGGAGNDTMSGDTGADVFVIRDVDTTGGPFVDVITDFSTSDDAISFEMAEITTFSDVTARLSQDGPDAVITFNDSSTLRLLGVDSTTLTAGNFLNGAAPICLAAGTRIRTPDGTCPIENLRVGDLVVTRDHGPQPIRAITRQTMIFKRRDDRARPIRIRAGALAAGRPWVDLVLSPQHRLLDLSRDVLVPAVDFLSKPGTHRMRGVARVRYFNLVLDRHEIIEAEGVAVETLLLTQRTLSLVTRCNGYCAATHRRSARPLSRGFD